MSKVVGADVSQASDGRMRAHQMVDGRHGEPPVLVPGLAAPQSWLVVDATLAPRPHVAAQGAPKILIGEPCVACEPCHHFLSVFRSDLGRRGLWPYTLHSPMGGGLAGRAESSGDT